MNGAGGRPRQTAAPIPSALATATHDERTAPVEPEAGAERWVRVLDVAGYEVSDAGRVRSLDRTIETVRGPRRLRGCLLGPYDDGHGYRAVTLSGRIVRVHVLVLTGFVGPRPIGAQTCHDNGVRDDNRLGNIAWCGASTNIADQVRHGRHARARRTHCPLDHPLVAPNLCAWAIRRGARTCLACSRTRSRAYRLRRNGIRVDVPMLRAIADSYLAEITAETDGAAA